MARKIVIIPSLLPLTTDQPTYQKVIDTQLDGEVNIIQMDVMDGKMVEEVTYDNTFIQGLRPPTSIKLEAHLMIVNPQKVIWDYVQAGCKSILYHQEQWSDPKAHGKLFDELAEQGIGLGVAINPDTQIDRVYPFLGKVNKILVMTVQPGRGGQSFILDCLRRIRILRNHTEGIIQVDGGIKPETIKAAYDAGANEFVAGSSVINDEFLPAVGIKRLLEAIEQ